MQVQTLTVVTLPDGTCWLRSGNRMVCWPEAPALLVDLGCIPALPDLGSEPLPGVVTRVEAPRPVHAERGKGRASDPAKVAEAKHLYESTNDKLTAIADQVGIKLPTLHGIATREGWKRRALVKGPK